MSDAEPRAEPLSKQDVSRNGNVNGIGGSPASRGITANGTVKAQYPDVGLNMPYAYQEETRSRAENDELSILCGPLLNFRRIEQTHQGPAIWYGSVLLVISPSRCQPEVRLKSLSEQTGDGRILQARKLHEASDKVFWTFELAIPLQNYETRWQYTILHARSSWSNGRNLLRPKALVVPAKSQSMRIMFHSCNGFSVGTDEKDWSGPALWDDVLNSHEQNPFHLMIGGGDQIYNDGVRVDGPLREWADMGNPKRRRDHPFGEELRAECDSFYFQNYVRWYRTEPFATANGQIPQMNIWDDHGTLSLGSTAVF